MCKNGGYNLAIRGEKLEKSASTTRDFWVNTKRLMEENQQELDKVFSFNMRTIFSEYVGIFCPDWMDKIDWEYFENLKSMSDNLEIQKNIWKELI